MPIYIELERQLQASRSIPFGRRGMGKDVRAVSTEGKSGVRGPRDKDIRGEEEYKDVRAVSTDIPMSTTDVNEGIFMQIFIILPFLYSFIHANLRLGLCVSSI
jgi:hypothetical protein